MKYGFVTVLAGAIFFSVAAQATELTQVEKVQGALDTWLAARAPIEKVTGIAAYISFGVAGQAIEAFAGKVSRDPDARRDAPQRASGVLNPPQDNRAGPLLAICFVCAVLTGTVVTAWRSTVGGGIRTPDGGTATGASGGVIRTPEGGAEEGPCATTNGGLIVWPIANKVSLSRPKPNTTQDTPPFTSGSFSLEPTVSLLVHLFKASQ